MRYCHFFAFSSLLHIFLTKLFNRKFKTHWWKNKSNIVLVIIWHHLSIDKGFFLILKGFKNGLSGSLSGEWPFCTICNMLRCRNNWIKTYKNLGNFRKSNHQPLLLITHLKVSAWCPIQLRCSLCICCYHMLYSLNAIKYLLNQINA